MPKIDDKLKAIPDSGEFWKASTLEGMKKLYKILIDKGFSDDEAIEFLDRAFHLVSGEYGN